MRKNIVDVMNQQQKAELSRILSTQVKWDHPLDRYTSFGIGGPAQALVQVEDMAELVSLHRFLFENKLPWRVIGSGTNLLVRDEGFAGVAILLTGLFKEHRIEETENSALLHAGAGCSLAGLLAVSLENGFSGFEFAVGIPGTLGGGIMMNAGAWGGCMADILQEVEVVGSHGRRIYQREQLKFDYRKSETLNKEPCIVTSANLKLQKSNIDEIRETCRRYRAMRRERQPVGFANAGSIFKNPEGKSAGRLIEESGLKGRVIGGAEVSNKHANFIVNRGTATAGDVMLLISEVQKKVLKESGILLDLEVHIL